MSAAVEFQGGVTGRAFNGQLPILMRMLGDVFAQILRTLWEQKLRSFLTMFGIAWGVGSLLLLVGLGEGFRSGNQREMAEFGQDIMFIFPGRAPVVQGSMRSARNYLLTYQDYLDVRDTAPYVRDASPVLARDDVRAVSEFASTNGEIVGVEPQFNQIRFLPLKQGRWLNDLDERQTRNVIVLGEEISRNLFTKDDNVACLAFIQIVEPASLLKREEPNLIELRLHADDLSVRTGKLAHRAHVISSEDRRSIAHVGCCVANIQIILIGQQVVTGRAHAALYYWGAPGKDEHNVLPEFRHLSLVARAETFTEPNQQQ